MTNFITKVKNLPDGVRGIVYKYLQHDNARIIKEAIKNNKMTLKYLKSHTINSYRSRLTDSYADWSEERFWIQRLGHRLLQDNNYMGNTHIISLALLELRPSNLKQKTYGEGTIERTNLSIGEIVRLRRLGLL